MNRTTTTLAVIALIAAVLAGVFIFREQAAPPTPPSTEVDPSTSLPPLPKVTKVERPTTTPLIDTQDAGAQASPPPRPADTKPALDRYGDTLGSQKTAFSTAFNDTLRSNIKRCIKVNDTTHDGQTFELEVHTGLNGDSVIVESVDAKNLPFDASVRACIEQAFTNQVLDLHAGAELTEPRHLLFPIRL